MSGAGRTQGQGRLRRRRGTATYSFGAGARENHDASAFYGRFRPPEVSDDDRVRPPEPIAEPFQCADARSMDAVADGSVALVVTSPPYFAGKQYEEELEREGVPSSYLEYLDMLTEVFAECVRTLEPGGRIAVNVANLGRKPYRSLSADVIRILEDDLGLLLRGEIIWQKAEGATGSCAWGSFRSPANPVLRDLTERVIVASKGRFDRALGAAERAGRGLPHASTLLTDDFLALTLDVWSIPPESARRVGHPAPFPVELPEQLIRLYTYEGDLVLDPFMGSGSALVAAARLGRRYVGYDTDPAYVEIARRRVAEEGHAAALLVGSEPSDGGAPAAAPDGSEGAAVPIGAGEEPGDATVGLRSAQEGRAAAKVAAEVLAAAGFRDLQADVRPRRSGVSVSFAATDEAGATWYFDVAGPFTSHLGGMQRSEVVWRTLGRAAAVRGRHPEAPFVVLTTHLPRRPGEGDAALRAAGPGVCFDVVNVLEPGDRERLARYAGGGHTSDPVPGFWKESELQGA